MLLRGHELELVVAVGKLICTDPSANDSCAFDADIPAIQGLVAAAMRYLTYRAVRLQLWDLAVDLANTLPQVWWLWS